MKEKELVQQELFDLLTSKDFEVNTLDSNGKSVTNIPEADIFSFEFSVGSNNYGTVVILLDSSGNFQLFYGDNIGKGMKGEDKNIWFDFLHQLRMFAKRNLMNFELLNINRLKYSMQGMASIKEGIFEGRWSGTSRSSYNKQPGRTKIIVRHNKKIQEGNARYGNIDSIYVDNSAGERFKLPYKSISGAKAMARHISEGGTPYDQFGLHISETMGNIATLGRFIRSNKSTVNEDVSNIIESCNTHYRELSENIKQISKKRGYKKYTEAWSPLQYNEDDAMIGSIRNVFTEEDTLDEAILPILARMGLSFIGAAASGIAGSSDSDSDSDDIEVNAELDEGDVIQGGFGLSGNKVDIPMWDSENKNLISPGIDYPEYAIGTLEEFDRFIPDDKVLFGITKAGDTVEVDSAHPAIIKYLADLFNRGGKVQKSGIVKQENIESDNMKQLDEFENWVGGFGRLVSEGTWAIPDTSDKIRKLNELLQDELPVGVDAIDATDALYDIIGDDELFDDLGDLAEEDPLADARPYIVKWMNNNATDNRIGAVMNQLEIPDDLDIDGLEESSDPMKAELGGDRVDGFIDDIEHEVDGDLEGLGEGDEPPFHPGYIPSEHGSAEKPRSKDYNTIRNHKLNSKTGDYYNPKDKGDPRNPSYSRYPQDGIQEGGDCGDCGDSSGDELVNMKKLAGI
jgi:hypothetical protein